MSKQDSNINKFELNYANTEFYERHKENDEALTNKPRQAPLEWHHWNDLYEFFRGYFNYFGDDISALDKDTFERIVKTIWRISHTCAVFDTRKECKENQLTFSKQLAEWANSIRMHNEGVADETDKTDMIGPFELWEMVMHQSTSK